MENENPYQIITTRRSGRLQSKESIFKLLDDCYAGGMKILTGGHLIKYPREQKLMYDARLERAIYFNYLQPLVDILTGFLFKTKPFRKLPESLYPVSENISKGKDIDQFMRIVSIQSVMHTIGILVDSPAFDPEQYQTQADATAAGLQPYACIYQPGQIRDYAIDDKGEMIWVLLDDTYIDDSDPFSKPESKKVYHLWTRETFQDFDIKIINKTSGKYNIIPGEIQPHPIGEVPFRLINWRDIDDSGVSDSALEDVALICRWIFNQWTLVDEQLISNTIQCLIMQEQNAGDIPDDIKKTGAFAIPLITYPIGTAAPAYISPGTGDINNIITAIRTAILEIFRKVGEDIDRDKYYQQSGVAKGKEFEKSESILSAGAKCMESTEEFIFRMAGKWMGVDIGGDNVKVEYNKEFQKDNIDIVLKRLKDLYLQTTDINIKKKTLAEMIKIVLPDVDAESMAEQAENGQPESFLNSPGTEMQTEENRELTQNEVNE